MNHTFSMSLPAPPLIWCCSDSIVVSNDDVVTEPPTILSIASLVNVNVCAASVVGVTVVVVSVAVVVVVSSSIHKQPMTGPSKKRHLLSLLLNSFFPKREQTFHNVSCLLEASISVRNAPVEIIFIFYCSIQL